jgi:glyoxylase-like metal-dependent hydrolase (beta-lactamase superfamily II)
MAFILEEENDAMFTGDNVLGHGTAVFDDLITYLRSLELMSRSFSGRAYPGHGAVVSNGPEKVRGYIVHRHRREEEIVRVLLTCDDMGKSLDDGGAAITTTTTTAMAATATEEALTARQLVEIIYKDVPRNLHDAAENGVLQVLRKLLHEGKVIEREDGKWEMAKEAGLK